MSKTTSPAVTENQPLIKGASNEVLKTYFTRIREFQKAGESYPIDFEDVWRLVYKHKQDALNALYDGFVEGEDFYLTQMGKDLRQIPKVVKIKDLQNGIKIEARLSVACMEYFVAKREKAVFEIYRLIFHKTMDEQESNTKFLSEAVYEEGQVYTLFLDGKSVSAYYEDGELWLHFSTLYCYLMKAGYSSLGGSALKYRCGDMNIRKKTKGMYINFEGLTEFVKTSKQGIEEYRVNKTYDVFGIQRKGSEYSFQFTTEQMNDILFELFSSPVRKARISDLLKKGGRHD